MRIAILIGLGAASVAAALAIAAPRPSGDVTVSDGQMRATLGGSANSAAYMVIANAGSRPDRLLSVTCACADRAEIHRSGVQGGMMTMAPAGPVVVPAHGRVAFSPGGLHVMLTGVRRRLAAGGRQVMTLRFERAGQVTAAFQVRARIIGQGIGPMRGMNP